MHDALLRVGEAEALRWEDVIWPEPDPITGEVHDDQPAKIIIRQSKSDQHGEGVIRSVSAATRRALELWGGVTWESPNPVSGPPGGDPTDTYVHAPSGPILGVLKHRIWMDVRKLVKGAGLNDGRRLTPHSCRIGATIDGYLIHGMDLPTLKTLGRWKSTAMVLYYLQPFLKELDPLADKFADDPHGATFATTK